MTAPRVPCGCPVYLTSRPPLPSPPCPALGTPGWAHTCPGQGLTAHPPQLGPRQPWVQLLPGPEAVRPQQLQPCWPPSPSLRLGRSCSLSPLLAAPVCSPPHRGQRGPREGVPITLSRVRAGRGIGVLACSGVTAEMTRDREVRSLGSPHPSLITLMEAGTTLGPHGKAGHTERDKGVVPGCEEVFFYVCYCLHMY